jgi:hypothetical protein
MRTSLEEQVFMSFAFFKLVNPHLNTSRIVAGNDLFLINLWFDTLLRNQFHGLLLVSYPEDFTAHEFLRD